MSNRLEALPASMVMTTQGMDGDFGPRRQINCHTHNPCHASRSLTFLVTNLLASYHIKGALATYTANINWLDAIIAEGL